MASSLPSSSSLSPTPTAPATPATAVVPSLPVSSHGLVSRTPPLPHPEIDVDAKGVPFLIIVERAKGERVKVVDSRSCTAASLGEASKQVTPILGDLLDAQPCARPGCDRPATAWFSVTENDAKRGMQMICYPWCGGAGEGAGEKSCDRSLISTGRPSFDILATSIYCSQAAMLGPLISNGPPGAPAPGAYFWDTKSAETQLAALAATAVIPSGGLCFRQGCSNLATMTGTYKIVVDPTRDLVGQHKHILFAACGVTHVADCAQMLRSMFGAVPGQSR